MPTVIKKKLKVKKNIFTPQIAGIWEEGYDEKI